MLRKSFVGIVALAFLWTVTLGAQVKEMPKAPAPLNAKTIDINSAAEADIAAIGIDKPVAKKIVEGRVIIKALETTLFFIAKRLVLGWDNGTLSAMNK